MKKLCVVLFVLLPCSQSFFMSKGRLLRHIKRRRLKGATFTVTATGSLNAVVTVQAPVSGTIQKLFVDYNSVVGQTIADRPNFQLQVEQSRQHQNALANLRKAKADVVDAKRTLKGTGSW
jgi:multidrug efflux pump subunit AcrA (membrane-fusion protein)